MSRVTALGRAPQTWMEQTTLCPGIQVGKLVQEHSESLEFKSQTDLRFFFIDLCSHLLNIPLNLQPLAHS